MENLFEILNNNLNSEMLASQYSPLTLAYIGDAVFELCVRTMVVKKNNMSANKLHRASKNYVNASAQSDMYNKIKNILTEDEFSVLKRGRNAKSYTSAKNASISDYRHATGVEALFGYLYLKGQNKRIIEIFNICIEENENI